MKHLIVALSALAVVVGVCACGRSADAPLRATTGGVRASATASAPAAQPSARQTGVSFSDFRSVECNLLGPGENGDPSLVFWVNLRVKSGITVVVHSLTIQWHRRSFTGPVIATEIDSPGPGKPPVTYGAVWAFAWANRSGLSLSQNSATGPNPVACTVEAISGTTTTS